MQAKLPTDSQERKNIPLYRGLLLYFPKALAAVARVSVEGNIKHYGPDAPLHWNKDVSTDEADALLRHLLEAGTQDEDGMPHSAHMAWRALALLERELDQQWKELEPDLIVSGLRLNDRRAIGEVAGDEHRTE